MVGWLVAIGFFLIALFAFSPVDAQTYEALVTRVVDGDTIRVEVEVWPGIWVRPAVRLVGIDTPELRGKCQHEKDIAQAAKVALVELLSAFPVVLLEDVKPDKFGGRVDAVVITGAGPVAEYMIAEGHARPYEGGTREKWCE